MKKHTKTLTVFIILIVALIMFASFFGIYTKNGEGEKISVLPNFKLGMNFGQTRVITAKVNEETNRIVYDSENNIITEEEGIEYTEEAGYKIVEEPINNDDVKTKENYKNAEKIIKERLEKNNVTEYTINLNEETGEIKIRIPENEDSDEIESIIASSGTLMLLDESTFENVLDNSHLKKAEVVYSQGTLETGVFLQISFDEEGRKELEELNKIYVETEEEQTNEQGETETVTNSKSVWVILNNSFLGTTVLPNIVYNNKIMITFGVSNDNSEIQEAIRQAQRNANLLNSGTFPLVYEFSNETQETKINEKMVFAYLGAIGIVFIIAYIYLVIRYKAKGFISVYFQIGYLAILLLIIRLTNVLLTMEGIAGIVISMVLELIFTYLILEHLEKQKEDMYKKANLEFFLNTLPIYAISVIFTFATKANISSFGMTLFWGIIMIYLYNFVFSKFIFENLNRRLG